MADFQRAVPIRTYEALWDDYLRDRLSRLRRPDLAGPHSVPRLDQRDDRRGDQVHPGLARDGRVEPQGRADDAGLSPELAAGFAAVSRPALSSWAARPTSSEPAPGVFEGDLSGIAAVELSPLLRPYTFPPLDLALETDWDRKLCRLAERASRNRSPWSAACRAGCSCSFSGFWN